MSMNLILPRYSRSAKSKSSIKRLSVDDLLNLPFAESNQDQDGIPLPPVISSVPGILPPTPIRLAIQI
jgi:hypothetical protein